MSYIPFEYPLPFKVEGGNPPVIVAANGELVLSMFWPIHEQTPEAESEAVKAVEKLAKRIAELLNNNDSLTARVRELEAEVGELHRVEQNRKDEHAAKAEYVKDCHHDPSLVIGGPAGMLCCECWALDGYLALKRISELDTSQLAPPQQCEAVMIATDAIEESKLLTQTIPREITALRADLAAARDEVKMHKGAFQSAAESHAEAMRDLAAAQSEAAAARELAKLPEDMCLSCGGKGGHHEGCAGTTGLIALQASLAAAQADRERLDWLSHNYKSNVGLDVGGYWYLSQLRWQDDRIRQAIDAARAHGGER